MASLVILAPIIRRIEIEERLRPVKRSDQILIALVFDVDAGQAKVDRRKFFLNPK